MTTLQELAADIRRQITTFSSEVTVVKRKTQEEKREATKRLKDKLRRVKNSLSLFKLEIENYANMANIDSFKSQLAEYQNNLSKLQNDINFMNTQNHSQQQLFQGATGITTEKRAETGQRKAVIQLGRQGQQKIFNAMDNMDKDLGEMQHIASNINVELQRQLQALDRIYNTVNDTDSALNRAKKHIRYFARQVYTDKIMMCLIVLIVIAIIVTVIMSIVGVGKGSFFSKT